MTAIIKEENPGIEFEWSLPQGSVAQTPEKEDGYEWAASQWGVCDAVCGGGLRQRRVYCRRISTQDRMPDYLCDRARKPAEEGRCNEHACKPMWKVGNWSLCSGGSGNGMNATGGFMPSAFLIPNRGNVIPD